MKDNIEKFVLEAARDAYSAQCDLRRRRMRYKRFTYGDQWGDMVRDSRGALVREGDLMAAGGRQPLTNNLIRRLVKTIVGRWRSMASENRRYDDPALGARLNSLAELDARMLEEFLISGCAIQRVSRETRVPAGTAVWVDNVSPRDFFVNAFCDPRGHDIRLTGMLHEMTPVELAARFGRGDRVRMSALLQRARAIAGGDGIPSEPLVRDSSGEDFARARSGYCRVIEIWTLDSAVAPSGADISMGWHCRWMLPDGTLLDQYHSPYGHGSHPFAIKYYPLTDGEVHSFVEDVVEQQKYINRLVVLIDKMMGASAKGVLLFPMSQKSPLVSWEEIADRWSRTDGVIPVMGRGETLPTQITGSGADAGAHQLLSLELKLFEDVSGVSNALLGQSSNATGGAGLFDAQVRNSTIAFADIFDTFESFLADRDRRILMCGQGGNRTAATTEKGLTPSTVADARKDAAADAKNAAMKNGAVKNAAVKIADTRGAKNTNAIQTPRL